MTDDRVTKLEQRLDDLHTEHLRHKELLDAITEHIQGVLRQIELLATNLAVHSTTEADHHANRVKLLGRVAIGISGLFAVLTSIYATVSGTTLQDAVVPMIKMLFGL